MSNATFTFNSARLRRCIDVGLHATYASVLMLALMAVMHFGIVKAPFGVALPESTDPIAQTQPQDTSSANSEPLRASGWAAWKGKRGLTVQAGMTLATSEVFDQGDLSGQMQRVCDWVAKRYRVSGDELAPALAEAESSARNAGLDPLLIVAMMAVESSFNPRAESRMGARGLMQVIPRWHMDKIAAGADVDVFFDPLVNVQVGTLVLVEGLQRYGSLQAALQYYNGARNDPEARYTKKVMAIKQQLASVAGSHDDV